jgi:RpiB/LacA/LacB family sugar-phosphate isomerase
MRVGIAADHAGFAMKKQLTKALRESGHEILDFGSSSLIPEDDYPDYVVPLARNVARGEVERGVPICGSGVGACVSANKVKGVRAALVHDVFSAHQGVEDDDMNVICFGARVLGCALIWDLTEAFIAARFNGAERHQRRLGKVIALEN